MRKIKAVFTISVLLTAVAFIPSGGAILNQVDGTVVPQNYAAEMQVCLDRSEGAGVLNAVFDVDDKPEVYLPVPGVPAVLTVQAEGAGYLNAFGWYNVGDDVSNPANLHEIFPCRSTAMCACDACVPGRWRSATVNFSTDPNYKGGYVGFYLITPELLTGGNNNDHCSHLNMPQHRIYYTQKLLNDDGDYVHYCVYTSVTHANAFYFGFEDLFRGGDNDLEDMLVFVEGLVPLCIPRVEVCDNSDNDCDGSIDEGLSRACSTACETGQEVCSGGVWGACSARQPQPETCNGIDDNCDGEIDEGLSRSCSSICESGTEYCVMGSWVDCSARLPSSEVCNNIDDNCDGDIDEGNPGGGAQCGTGVGACEFGTETCLAGTIVCTGGIGPQPEVCNGRDDNCDGSTDDGDPGGGEVCGTDVGLCQAGVYHCVGGAIVCVGEIGPSPEVCNSADDNCDGAIDEGNPGGGAPCGVSEGECEPGIETCVSGGISCVGGLGPVTESCDGLDNDCNGLIDDGDPGGGAACGSDTGECTAGTEHCIDGSIVCVGGNGPTPEICDNLDNNCDTQVDEGDPGGGDPCGADLGVCLPGTWHCVGGVLVCVGGIEPTEEICDGLDNDCDGETDEGNPGGGLTCGTDEGECEPGITWCSGSDVPPPCTPPDPLPDPPEVLCLCETGFSEEVCDCLDNDCDGLTDELGVGDACMPWPNEGECSPGQQYCVDCEWQCSGDVGPSPEVCDCLDNDCNGETDDGEICGEGICIQDAASCYCALPCNPANEFPCPAGKICVIPEGYDAYYCIGDPCVGVECTDCTQTCLGGECVDKCDLRTCEEDEVCSYSGCSAICVPRNCYVTGYECREGQRCQDGVCVPDPCYGVSCGELQFCRDGACFDSCTVSEGCPEGQVCHDGACIQDMCWNIECTGGRVCNPETGVCEENGCAGVSCPPPLVCIDGNCTDDPCSFITCPEGFVCVGDTCIEQGLVEDDHGEEGEDASSGRVLVTSTGGGGCAGCALSGGDEGSGGGLPALLMLLLVPVALLLRRRKSEGGKLLTLLPLLLLPCLQAGCHTDYECLANCDALVGPEGEDGTDGVEGMDIHVEGQDQEGDAADVPAEELPCNPLAEEECNGIDDNCNGEIDEGFDLTSDPGHCGSCGNACNFPHAFAGCQDSVCVMTGCDINFYDCAADDPSDPETLGCETMCFRTRPQDDVCNNVDDDCNCVVDDLIDKTSDLQNCGGCGVHCNPRNATGACEDSVCVIEACNDGYWDLNDTADDGCEYECNRCQRTEGSCEPGLTCCTDTGGETCNGLDDDCNDEVDEGNPGGGVSCGSGYGLCHAGLTNCVGGRLVCEGASDPEPEICDGLDNDCDNVVDNGDPGSGADCGTSAGECTPGVEHCVDGFLECVGSVGPQPELCDGLDNDCDGIVDDGNPEGGASCGSSVGTCAPGTERCTGGALVCTGGIGPAPEICDNLDNNCDTQVDEGDPEGGAVCGSAAGECSTGISHCLGGHLECVGETPPSPERCNSLDDDCDGAVDDGDPEGGGTCGSSIGECSTGVVQCQGGSLQCAGEVRPTTEQCDGLDNDCDGSVDEGVPVGVRCGSNRGTCEYGATQCIGGAMDCVGDVEPVSPEPCDGLDNDCNGTIDDNLAPPAITCLSAGVCAGTTPTCDGALGYRCHYPASYQATETWCDGANNDCDSSTDEGCPLLAASDTRLDTGAAAGASTSTEIDVATDGAGVVHVVYIDRRSGAADIYYNHSVDGGVTWLATDIRLDTNGAGATNSVLPTVTHGVGDRAFTAWSDFRTSTSYRDIYEVRSTNDGTTWSNPDVRIDAGANIDSYGADIAADQLGNVYVVYEELLANRSRQVMLARSTDNGATWLAPVRIDHNPIAAPAIASEPHIAHDGAGAVYVAWRDNRHGNAAIYFNYSLNSGVSWQATDRRLDTDMPEGAAYSGHPQIAGDSSGNVYVVWEDYRNGYADIYVNSSNNRGQAWRASDTRLDKDTLGHDSLNPVIAADVGGMAWVAWNDLRNGLPDIYLSRTASGGAAWSAADVRIDADGAGTGGSYFPSIDASGVLVTVGWEDDRSGDFDIRMNFSLDGGVTFQPVDFRVDNAAGAWDAVDCNVVVESGRAHFIWVDYRNGTHMNGDIYVRTLR